MLRELVNLSGAPDVAGAKLAALARVPAASAYSGSDVQGPDFCGRAQAQVAIAAEYVPARSIWPIALNRFPFRQVSVLRRIVLRIMALITQDQRRALEFVIAALRSLIDQGATLERNLRSVEAAGQEQMRLLAEGEARKRNEMEAKWERRFAESEQLWRGAVNALELRVETRLRLDRATAAQGQSGQGPDGQASSGPASSGPASSGPARAESNDLDFTLIPGLYARFEEAHRGSPELIRLRQSVYLPDLRSQPSALDALPVVDLGCGRGEWLELMRENGIQGVGVDLNPDFLSVARGKGFAVSDMDAVAWLRSQPDASLRGVSAFHLIEHLPMTQLFMMLLEARRALAPGGVLILETPNPENLIVGACAFYLDPTHRRQIVPDFLQLLAREVGFEAPRLVRLSEYRLENPLKPLPPEDRLAEALNPMIEAVSRTLFAAPDYALIAVRA